MNAETRAAQLELEHLQTQIEPHFLFNALNALVAEISDRPHVAEEMTRRLADYLRYSLGKRGDRSEEHTSELQSLLRSSYAVCCLNKKNKPILLSRTQPSRLEKKSTKLHD